MAKGSRTKPGPVSLALAPILKDAFLELLITQEKFGELLGDIPQSTVSVYLLGERALDMDLFVKMCRVLTVDPVEVLSAALHAAEQ